MINANYGLNSSKKSMVSTHKKQPAVMREKEPKSKPKTEVYDTNLLGLQKGVHTAGESKVPKHTI